jgi:ubiquinone/menaquinone biosynthesis C-methylase UbiE
VDVSLVWLETARRRLARYPNVAFKLGEIASLDLPDEAYDVVFVHFVLHDIPARERLQVVAHLTKKLAPGGRWFIREPLEHLAREEIVRLMQENGLGEIRSSISQVPLMGPTYEGIFGKANGSASRF